MITRFHVTAAAVVLCALFPPQSALAQQNDQWEVTLAPLYLWMGELNGTVTARNTTVPFFMDFADAADKLAGAFSFHLEARKGKWGGFGDFNFMRLSSDSEFTAPLRVGQGTERIQGTFQLDNIIFEAGASYLLHQASQISLIGGLRTYTLSPKLEFTGAHVQVEPIDASRTSTDGFVGVTLRPALTPKVRLISRADIGGGSAEVTWNALIGVEYRFKPAFGVMVGYRGYGIDVGSDDGEQVREFDLTQYGPIFGLNVHWGQR